MGISENDGAGDDTRTSNDVDARVREHEGGTAASCASAIVACSKCGLGVCGCIDVDAHYVGRQS